ncbi:MAG: hypothetical protein IJI44_00505 [Erysipelotrichaceae bacterium]|nr:hypothetical protein [Erysipelotrichaceae bacterium]
MKKFIALFLSLLMVLTLVSCSKSEEKPVSDFEWTRQGYFTDEDGDIVSITWMDDENMMEEDKGWYVGIMAGDLTTGSKLDLAGETLHGNLIPSYEEGELIATVSEEGENGIVLEIEGGNTYHLTPMEMPEAKIFINIKTEGCGFFDYAKESEGLVFDEDYPATSAVVNLAEAETYILEARPEEGNKFVKWTKNGEDLSTESIITETFDADAEYVAVFEPAE